MMTLYRCNNRCVYSAFPEVIKLVVKWKSQVPKKLSACAPSRQTSSHACQGATHVQYRFGVRRAAQLNIFGNRTATDSAVSTVTQKVQERFSRRHLVQFEHNSVF